MNRCMRSLHSRRRAGEDGVSVDQGSDPILRVTKKQVRPLGVYRFDWLPRYSVMGGRAHEMV
jgi:hypothetical protein